MAKCIYENTGPSGSTQKIDKQCILPLNSLYEKIYVFLWFWFCLLAVVTFFGLIWDIFTIFKISHRSKFIKQKLHEVSKRNEIVVGVEIIVAHLDFGDWRLVYHLLENLQPVQAVQFLSHLSMAFNDSESVNIKMDKH